MKTWKNRLAQAAGGLLLILVILALPQVAKAEVLGSGQVASNVQWKVEKKSDTETVLTISGNGYMADYDIGPDQPWFDYRSQITLVVVGPGVMSIGNNAFCDLTNMTSVTLPQNSLTKIGERAFSDCKSLNSIQIPATVKEIGMQAFYYCSNLESLNIPNGIKKIGIALCMHTNLKSITIPAGVTEICLNAFAQCYNLEEVKIPASVTVIGETAFSKCRNLENITIPAGVTDIGGNAFNETPWLESLGNFAVVNGILLKYQGTDTNVVIPGTVKKISGYAFYNTEITGVTIPAGVTEIGVGAFSSCDELKTVKLPSGVTRVENHAFSYCENLTSLTFSDGLTEVGEYAFGQCPKLTTVTLPASLKKIEEMAFYEDFALTDVYYGGSRNKWDKIVIGDNNQCLKTANIHCALPDEAEDDETGGGQTKTDQAKAASGYALNTSKQTAAYNGKNAAGSAVVTIPATITSGGKVYKVTEIAAGALKNNKTVTKVVIGSNVTKIGKEAFRGCVKLKTVTVGKNVSSIGAKAFYQCKALTKITIPAGVKAIGKSAFQSCSKLKKITIKTTKLTKKNVGSKAFKGTAAKATVKVPKKVKAAYKKWLTKKGISKKAKIK